MAIEQATNAGLKQTLRVAEANNLAGAEQPEAGSYEAWKKAVSPRNAPDITNIHDRLPLMASFVTEKASLENEEEAAPEQDGQNCEVFWTSASTFRVRTRHCDCDFYQEEIRVDPETQVSVDGEIVEALTEHTGRGKPSAAWSEQRLRDAGINMNLPHTFFLRFKATPNMWVNSQEFVAGGEMCAPPPTETPTPTESPTPTHTVTVSVTPSPSPTPTETPTETPVTPTESPTPSETPEDTPTPTDTPTIIITATPSPTPEERDNPEKTNIVYCQGLTDENGDPVDGARVILYENGVPFNIDELRERGEEYLKELQEIAREAGRYIYVSAPEPFGVWRGAAGVPVPFDGRADVLNWREGNQLENPYSWPVAVKEADPNQENEWNLPDVVGEFSSEEIVSDPDMVAEAEKFVKCLFMPVTGKAAEKDKDIDAAVALIVGGLAAAGGLGMRLRGIGMEPLSSYWTKENNGVEQRISMSNRELKKNRLNLSKETERGLEFSGEGLLAEIRNYGDMVEFNKETGRYRFNRAVKQEKDEELSLLRGVFLEQEDAKEIIADAFKLLREEAEEGNIEEKDLAAARLHLSTLNLLIGKEEYNRKREELEGKQVGIKVKGRTAADLKEAEEAYQEFPLRYLEVKNKLYEAGLLPDFSLPYTLGAVREGEKLLAEV